MKRAIFCFGLLCLLPQLSYAAGDPNSVAVKCNTDGARAVAEEGLSKKIFNNLKNSLGYPANTTLSVAVKFTKKGRTAMASLPIDQAAGALTASVSEGAPPSENEGRGQINISMESGSVDNLTKTIGADTCQLTYFPTITVKYKKTVGARKVPYVGRFTDRSKAITITGVFTK